MQLSCNDRYAAADPYKDAITQGVGPSDDALAFNVQANNVFGIYFHSSGATQSRVTNNCLRSNNTSSAASGNTVRGNDAYNSGHFDCEDDTTGTGTAHTANTWQNNNGHTSSLAGLCTGGH